MVERNKRFVYGTFNWVSKATKQTAPIPPAIKRALKLRETDPADRIAIEIVREYGPNELIGKIYTKGTANNWIALAPADAEEADWFQWYKKFPANARIAPKIYYFDMEGSGHWTVLHFRNESDDTGPYVAAALKYVD